MEVSLQVCGGLLDEFIERLPLAGFFVQGGPVHSPVAVGCHEVKELRGGELDNEPGIGARSSERDPGGALNVPPGGIQLLVAGDAAGQRVFSGESRAGGARGE